MSPGVITQEFVYEEAPFPSCHAATIVETKAGMLVAFFGGTRERHPDVCIYTSRKTSGKWSPPVAVADGLQSDGSREPTWNPVLFQPKDGTGHVVLQGRAESFEVVGHGQDQPRRRPNLVPGAAPRRRHPRAHQEQAGATAER
jgi:hypothetical protein